MALVKQVSRGSGNDNQNNSKARTTTRACNRCRLLHKKCNLDSRGRPCSNCEAVRGLCKGGGDSELRIRFAEFSQPTSAGQLASPRLRFQQRPPSEPSSNSNSCEKAGPVSEDQQDYSTPRADESVISPSDLGSIDSTSSRSLNIFDPRTSSPLANLGQTSNPQSHYGPQSISPLTESSFLSLAPEHVQSPVRNSTAPFLIETPHACDGSRHASKDCQTHGRSPNYSEVAGWPLSGVEAKLLKHFFAVLLPWFDYCWEHGPFRSYIQYAIHRDLGTLYALLAVAARHLEVTGGSQYSNSNEYEQKCLSILIPTLNSREAAQLQDDAVLVSALLLRLLDEMTDPADSPPIIRHTVSAPLFLRISQHTLQHSDLRNAAMAIVLRQEIHIANLTKRPAELMGRDCGIDASLEPASDITWTCRIMSHTAEVTNYAYGPEPRTERLWDRLWQYLEEWAEAKPASFLPLYQSRSKNNKDKAPSVSTTYDKRTSPAGTFPEIYYLYDCPVAAQQYLEICKMILLAHDPRMPGLGLGRTMYVRVQEHKIREAVRNICGIWLSNPEYAPARVLAGLAISMAGELFTDVSETVQLLDIMTEAELHVGWPCLKVSPRLRSFWMSEAGSSWTGAH